MDIPAPDTERYVTFRPMLEYQTVLKREKDGQAQRVFFYKRRTDGVILPFMEQEAAMQMKGSHRHILEQIGCSDMKAYHQAIAECGLKDGQVVKLSVMQKVIKDAWDAELAAATGNFATPMDNSVHFIDGSIPPEMRSTLILPKD